MNGSGSPKTRPHCPYCSSTNIHFEQQMMWHPEMEKYYSVEPVSEMAECQNCDEGIYMEPVWRPYGRHL